MKLANLFKPTQPKHPITTNAKVRFNIILYNEMLSTIKANPHGAKELQEEINIVKKYLISVQT